MSFRAGILAALAVLVLGPGTASAADAPAPSAFRALAQEMARQIQQAAPEPPLRLELSTPAPAARSAFFTLLASELASRDLPVVASKADTPDAGKASRTEVRLSLDVKDGLLRARGSLFGTWRNFWAGKTPLRPPKPAAVLDAQVPADSEALSFLAPSPHAPAASAREPTLVHLARLDQPLAALATGDLDGDGLDEICALEPDALIVFDGQGKRIARHTLDALPPAQVRTRDPFGLVVVLENPARIAVFSASFASGEVLSLENGALSVEGPSANPEVGSALLHFSTRFTPGENTFAPASDVRFPFSAYSGFLRGGVTWGLVLRPGAEGRLWQGKASRALQGVGSGGALADLDGDGSPELVTTAPERAPSPDRVEIRPADAVLRSGLSDTPPRASLPVEGEIVLAATAHLAHGPADAVVLGVRDAKGGADLLLVRGSATP